MDKSVNKYTDEAVDKFRGYHPQVGDTWIADETVLKIDGNNVWMYDIIDEKTRYLLATRITQSRTTQDAQRLMETASNRAGKRPKVVITDKQNSYLDGIELAYGADSEHVQGSPFTVKKDESTSLIERWHGTLKQRTKVMRGLKSIDSAIQFTDGYLVYYNFLRPHEKLEGRTPAEEAKVSYPLKHWADIIRDAKPSFEVLVTPEKVSKLSEQKPFIRPIAHRHYNPNRIRKPKPHRRRMPKSGIFASEGKVSRHYFRGAKRVG